MFIDQLVLVWISSFYHPGKEYCELLVQVSIFHLGVVTSLDILLCFLVSIIQEKNNHGVVTSNIPIMDDKLIILSVLLSVIAAICQAWDEHNILSAM